MINKYYTFLIASESDHINKSFRLSRGLVALILIFIFAIFSFLCISIAKYFINSETLHRINYLKDFESNISELVYSQPSSNSDSVVVKKIKNIIKNNGPKILMIAPVNGYVTQGIDSTSKHNGIDIVSNKGDIIQAANSGYVIFSGFDGELGNTLIISHPYNYFTLYGHCDTILVKERQRVNKGDVVALLGDSGDTSAPHLHFEIWKNNETIDPRKIINKYGDLDVSKEW